MNDQADVVVIGAGLVGLALAGMIAKSGLRVIVLEQHEITFLHEGLADQRPLTLNHASYTVLKTLGVNTYFNRSVSPIDSVHVSLQSHFGSALFEREEFDVAHLGYVVSYGELKRALYEFACAQGVNFIWGQLDTIVCASDAVDVKACVQMKGCTLTASVCIAADGAESACRKQLGFNLNQTASLYRADVFYLDLLCEHDNRSYQRFTKTGSMAILPALDRKQYRAVWTHDSVTDHSLVMQDPCAFIQSIYGDYLPEITAAVHQSSFPLKSLFVSHPVKQRCVLLGNSAYTFYPITAQGFNMGVLDAAALAQILVVRRNKSLDIGHAAGLDEYAQWRLPPQREMMTLTQGAASLFDGSLASLNGLRGLALSAVDMMPVVKKRLGMKLLGLSGRVPDLALGVNLGCKYE